MAIGVEVVAGFAKEPTGSGETFAQGKEVGGDVLLGSWKAFSGGGELIHESETEVMFFGGKVDRVEPAAEMAGGIPTNLAAKAGGIAGSLDGLKLTEELEEDGLEEIPIFGAARKESAKPKVFALDLVNINDGEVALAAGGDIEAHAIGGFSLEQFEKAFVDEIGDLVTTVDLIVRAESAELLYDLAVLEMDANDFVIQTAVIEGTPLDDVIGGCTERIAHVRLLKDFLGAGAGRATGNKFFRIEGGIAGAIDDLDETEFDGIGKGDAVVEVPRRDDGWELRVES